MIVYRVKNWDRHYENNRSRELKRPEWLPLPNSFDGTGFMELMDHPAGMSHYGAWCLLLAAASRMPTRGLLISDSGRPLTVKDIARMTRGSARTFDEALPRLIAIGWMEATDDGTATGEPHYTASGEDAEGCDAGSTGGNAGPIPQETAGIPHPPAGKRSLEGEGEREGEREPQRGRASSGEPPADARPPVDPRAKNREALAKAIRKQGMDSSATAVLEWGDLLSGRGGCTTAAEGLDGFAWIMNRAKRDGLAVKYAKHAGELADKWAGILVRRRTAAPGGQIDGSGMSRPPPAPGEAA